MSFALDDFLDGEITSPQISKNWSNEFVGYANEILNFYDSCPTIEDYFSYFKKDKLRNIDSSRFEDLMFDEYDVNPADLDIEIEILNKSRKFFYEITQSIASMPIDDVHSFIFAGIKVKGTEKYLGFYRISLPVLAVAPRHDFFGEVPNGFMLNKCLNSGTIIISTPSFGYNCLGGKLAALMCCSHEMREFINKNYDNKEICYFETTSLYGSIKQASQYDGLEPYIKKGGLTESKIPLFMPDELMKRFKNDLIEYVGKKEYDAMKPANFQTNSRHKEFALLLNILGKELINIEPDLANKLKQARKTTMLSKTQKGYYRSTYGFTDESVKNFVLDKTNELIKGPRFDNFYQDNLIKYWKNKAEKRWLKLKEEGRLKTENKLYTKEEADTSSIHGVGK